MNATAANDPNAQRRSKYVYQHLLLINDVSLLIASYTAQNLILGHPQVRNFHGLGSALPIRLTDSAIRECMVMSSFGTLTLLREMSDMHQIAFRKEIADSAYTNA
jgi:hypothetical protein